MLALTMGDPAGIGGEISHAAWRAVGGFAVIGDPIYLATLGPIQIIENMAQANAAKTLPVLPVRLKNPVTPGQPDPAHAPAIIESIETAFRLTQQGETAAMVTNPISKAVLQSAGFPYPGHTEFLAHLANREGHEIMMLASPMLRVVPVTIHVSLRRALETLTTEKIVKAARATHAALRRDFAIPHPRLAIAGLNPHAGEQGRMGDEETRLIAPAIAILRAEGLTVTGPHPPDTMFTPLARASYDAAICMYHDQALIPLKTLDMAGGVNVTLGLPVVRTSPDHGTAFDIAGLGRADPSSLIAALRLAQAIASNRARACA